MLSPDVRIEGFDASDWFALGEVLGARTRDAPTAGGVLVLVDSGRIVQVVSTLHGTLPPPLEPTSLETLVREQGARWGLRAERGALEAVMDRLAERLEPGDDLTDQGIALAHVLRELSVEGRLELFPRDARGLRIPKRAAIDRALDVLCPVGKTLVFGAFQGGDVHTSVALRRGPRGFDRIVGPAEHRSDMGLRSGKWARDCHGLARAVELSVGPVALGGFAQMETWKVLLASKTPGAWTAALAARDVVLHPIAPAVAIPIGIDLGRVAWTVGKDMAERLGFGGAGGGKAIGHALERLLHSDARRDVARVLGFDPLRALSSFLESLAEDR